ncbi:hypothetical protein C1645_831633, partial [Glomus cerebriforme]
KPNLKFDSTLIESKHISLFASWIDKNDSSHYSRNNNPYDFKLLYRSSQDGIDTESFHRNCDNKGATIWVAKIKNSTQLIGGYNPLDWNGNGCKLTTDSFIFNFANGDHILTARINHINEQAYQTIFCHPTYGPTMGKLHCNNNIWEYSDGNSGDNFYPDIGIPKGRFEVEDYEVFQVIRK